MNWISETFSSDGAQSGNNTDAFHPFQTAATVVASVVQKVLAESSHPVLGSKGDDLALMKHRLMIRIFNFEMEIGVRRHSRSTGTSFLRLGLSEPER